MIAIASPKRELGTRSEARTKEIERCLKMKPDFIFMLDDDQTFPIQTFKQLDYQIYLSDIEKVDMWLIDAPNKNTEDSNIKHHPDSSLAYFTISCCLMRASIFDRMSRPWFSSAYAWVEEGLENGKIKWRIDKKHSDDNIGEDVYFSRKCIEADLKIKVLPNLKCKHFDLYKL